ncbi:hypothetical protein Q4543_17670 [Salipiger sp. 1_MG-2023]|uniref:hypothetical protein n=1 Tax=Salipiger sp. 1_MG-2023 TaxID=3062665 RepID=UPI0026E2E157|nr:hypothetical protein [Salipiger sp. 1_MG-2023]MDO6587344.1 hypothetical protein [Salipiger sp. 1_MG-2023]
MSTPIFGSICVDGLFSAFWLEPGRCSTFIDGEFQSRADAREAAQAEYARRSAARAGSAE